jgi:hypothetical protein
VLDARKRPAGEVVGGRGESVDLDLFELVQVVGKVGQELVLGAVSIGS